MGKGIIIDGGDGGLYNIDIQYYTANIEHQIEQLTAQITSLSESILTQEAEIADLWITLEGLANYDRAERFKLIQQKENEIAHVKFSMLSLQKRKETLESVQSNKQMSVWCADFTEDLTGEVATIEIPGESNFINIAPAYNGLSTYCPIDDGQLVPTLAMTPAQSFYNLCMLPGWQKWKPTYRYGIISNIDIINNIASVTLEDIKSSQQNLSINYKDSYDEVPVEYMTCNAVAFEDGDSVIVKFQGQDKDEPVIIGFKDHPVPCDAKYVVIMSSDSYVMPEGSTYCIVWDLVSNRLARLEVEYPCLVSDIAQILADNFVPIEAYNLISAQSFTNWRSCDETYDYMNRYGDTVPGVKICDEDIERNCYESGHDCIRETTYETIDAIGDYTILTCTYNEDFQVAQESTLTKTEDAIWLYHDRDCIYCPDFLARNISIECSNNFTLGEALESAGFVVATGMYGFKWYNTKYNYSFITPLGKEIDYEIIQGEVCSIPGYPVAGAYYGGWSYRESTIRKNIFKGAYCDFGAVMIHFGHYKVLAERTQYFWESNNVNPDPDLTYNKYKTIVEPWISAYTIYNSDDNMTNTNPFGINENTDLSSAIKELTDIVYPDGIAEDSDVLFNPVFKFVFYT